MAYHDRRDISALVTELPTPEPGVIDQIMDEILTNRSLFLEKEFSLMSKENPDLRRRFARESMSSPSNELSTNWGLVYVVAHTRTRSGAGRLPKVEDVDLLQGVIPDERLFVPREGNIVDMLTDTASRIRRFELFDEERSPELAGYWKDVNKLRQRDRAIVFPIENLVFSLHTQAERNRQRVEKYKRAIPS